MCCHDRRRKEKESSEIRRTLESEGKITRQLIRKRNEGGGTEHRGEKQCFLKEI